MLTEQSSEIRDSEEEMIRSNEPLYISSHYAGGVFRLSILNNVEHMQTVSYIKMCLDTRESGDKVENTLIREQISCSNMYLGIKLIFPLVLDLMD